MLHVSGRFTGIFQYEYQWDYRFFPHDTLQCDTTVDNYFLGNVVIYGRTMQHICFILSRVVWNVVHRLVCCYKICAVCSVVLFAMRRLQMRHTTFHTAQSEFRTIMHFSQSFNFKHALSII